jgi:hypothetical protein
MVARAAVGPAEFERPVQGVAVEWEFALEAAESKCGASSRRPREPRRPKRARGLRTGSVCG